MSDPRPLEFRTGMHRRVDGRWDWSISVFSGRGVIADCFIESGRDFDSEEAAEADRQRVVQLLGLPMPATPPATKPEKTTWCPVCRRKHARWLACSDATEPCQKCGKQLRPVERWHDLASRLSPLCDACFHRVHLAPEGN